MKVWELKEGEEYVVNGLYSTMACEKYRIKNGVLALLVNLERLLNNGLSFLPCLFCAMFLYRTYTRFY